MDGSRLRILFVDDSPNVLEGIERLLYGMDREWDIHYAESGIAALTLMEDGAFDVVATDLRMPGMDGSVLIGRIREVSPTTRCLLLCGDTEDPEALALARQGCPLVEKPCDSQAIRGAVEAAVNHGPERAQTMEEDQ